MSDAIEATTAEARLLAAAMLRHRPRWKSGDLADAASMKIGTVRNILKGYRTESAGITRDVIPPADTLAVLADALGNITQADLRGIGRGDAARALEILSDRVDSAAESDADRLEKIRDELDSLIRDLREKGTQGA